MPRIAGRQVHRSNVSASTSEEYFRISIFVPLLDDVIADMGAREKFFEKLFVNQVLPLKICSHSNESLQQLSKNIAEVIIPFCDDNVELIATQLFHELQIWQCKWESESKINDIDIVFALCDVNIFPLLSKTFGLFAALPISVATAERSFSTLRRLKTWLRSTMQQERLNGLALLHIHRDIELNVNEVIDFFATKKKRHDDFTL